MSDTIVKRDPDGAVMPSGLFRDNSGKYRWVYELPMLKSFFLLFEVWKVLLIGLAAVFLINVIAGLVQGQGSGLLSGALVSAAIPAAILAVISLPAYYIVARANNGKYTVLFEMDDSGIDHVQIKTGKAAALDALAVFVGGAVGNRTATAAGLLSATGASLYSRFSSVRKITVCRRRNLIKLAGPLFCNQVYVSDEDFDFVRDHIVMHCPHAALRED